MAKIRRSPVEVGSLSHYLQGFVDPRWLAGFLNHHQNVSNITHNPDMNHETLVGQRMILEMVCQRIPLLPLSLSQYEYIQAACIQ